MHSVKLGTSIYPNKQTNTMSTKPRKRVKELPLSVISHDVQNGQVAAPVFTIVVTDHSTEADRKRDGKHKPKASSRSAQVRRNKSE